MKKSKAPRLNRNIRGPLGNNANLHIIARNRATKKILVGGLGGLGAGEMWFDEEPIHASYPGYKAALLD